MAIVYCNDGGSNTSPYDTLVKAATTFLVAVDFASAGDDIYIGMDHAETPGAVVYTFPGTAAAPNRVISINTGTENYDKADNIQVAATDNVTIRGFVKFYGFSISTTDGMFSTITNNSILFDDSIIEFTGASKEWRVGNSDGRHSLTLNNTSLNWSGGGANSGFQSWQSTHFKWHGGVLSWSGTQPTILFNSIAKSVHVDIAGVDLSAVTNPLIDLSDLVDMKASFHHCLKSTGAVTTGTINSVDTEVLSVGFDDTTGNNLYDFEYVNYYGSIVHDDAIFVTTGGASDGTTPISWKMVTTANAKEFSEPLISPPIVVWVDGTGSKTFTVQCLWDSVTDIQNDEIWLEVEFLEASADTDSAFANDGLADILASPADQTTNSTAWTETLTNDNEFAIAVTATVNRVGPALCRVHLAKPSTTVYVDPKVTRT